MDILCKTMGSDFKGFLGATLRESGSVHFGYSECVPSIDLHLPIIQSNDLSYMERTNVIFRDNPGLSFGYPERAPSIGLRLPRIQLNDLFYMEQTNNIFRDGSPDLCVHRRFPCNTTYIMHLESRLCRFDVAPVRFLRSNELFRHHTPSSRSRKDSYHKRRHQGSR